MKNKNSIEKPNDFKLALKRLFKALISYKVILTFALLLSAIGAVISIRTPDKLSILTDEISKGIKVNTTSLETISNCININENDLKDGLLFARIMQDESISEADKLLFMQVAQKISLDQENTFEYLKQLPDSIKTLLFTPTKIDKVLITSDDLIDFSSIMTKVDKDDYASSLYSLLEDAPKSIKKVVYPQMNLTKIKKIGIYLFCLYLFSAIINYIAHFLLTIAINTFAKNMREKITHKINRLPLKFFDNHLTGDLLSIITNDVDTVSSSLDQSFETIIAQSVLLIGAIIMMFVTNYIMAITAIVSSLLGLILMFLILSKSQKYFIQRQKEIGLLNGHIEEIYTNENIIKVYNASDDMYKNFDKLNTKVYECNRMSQFLSGLMGPLMNFTGNFGYICVCVCGAMLVQKDMITFGVIVAFIVYVRLFTNPLNQLSQAFTSLQSTLAASDRIFNFLESDEMIDESHLTEYLDPSKVKGNIEFKNVSFGYNDDKTIIKNFSLKATPGQKIAIVGPTGAGKTTLVNLLMKFYDINSGTIVIEGKEIQNLKRENIHELFSMVLQDTWLFNGTIKENLRYNLKDITDKDIEKVCENVGASHFIKTLPKGFNTIISEKESVSAGERQLLTIARATLKNAPFLILDEATSNVDTRTEELVQEAMDKLTKGKTSFIIAHRLSTIKNADLILVLNNGNIVEQGTHDELIMKNGFYADLYNSQFTN